MDLEVYPVGELRLRTLLRWRQRRTDGDSAAAAVQKRFAELNTDDNRRQIAHILSDYVFGLEPDQYSRFRGAVSAGEKLDLILVELTLESELLGGSDQFSFGLQYDASGECFSLLEAHKLVQGFGADGCVPLKKRARFNPQVMRDRAVFGVAERFGRVIDEREIRWDWQPRWNFADARLAGGEAESTLRSLYPSYEEASLPPYLLLATWSFSALQQDWGEEGRFVQLVIDPSEEKVVHHVSDEWHLLY